eukprot:844188-Rhodomonas_salina.1
MEIAWGRLTAKRAPKGSTRVAGEGALCCCQPESPSFPHVKSTAGLLRAHGVQAGFVLCH